jgi:hypothetical protein
MHKIVVCFCLLLSKIISFGQCDNTLKPSDNTKVAYQARGNRCEGEYSAKVGAPSLELVSFTIGIFSYKLEKTESVEIKNSTGFVINIRSSAIPLNTYYRMDALLENGKTFKWDIKDVLFDLKIPSNFLGVYGWFSTEKEKTYVPVKPISSNYDKTKTDIYFVVRPSEKALSVKYRYAKIGQNLGGYKDVTGSFRTGQSIQIILPPDLPGTNIIEIAALLEAQGGWIKKQYKISIK